jgi:hypothetical protein
VLLALVVAGALALRFPLAAPVRLGLLCVVVLLALSAVAVGRGAVLASTVGFAGAAVLLFASVLPGAVPPPVPSWVVERAGSRPLFTATQNPGLYSFLVGQSVHRASGEAPMLRALEEGQALLVTRDERALLPPSVTARLVPPRPLAPAPRPALGARGGQRLAPGRSKRAVRADEPGGPCNPSFPLTGLTGGATDR